MHVLYITERTPWGAGEYFLYPEINALKAQGHEVTLVPVRVEKSQSPSGSQEVDFWRGKSICLPLLGRKTFRLAVKEFILHPFKVMTASLSVVLASGLTRNALRNLQVIPKALAVSSATRRMAPDHIHAYWATQPATVAYIVHRLTGVPWSFTGHRWDLEAETGLACKLTTAKFIRCISEHGAAAVRQRVGNSLQNKVHVIHVGTWVPTKPPRRRRTSKGGTYRIGLPANLIESKGHRYLMEAASLLRLAGIKVELDFYGDGPTGPALRHLADSLGLGTVVRFHGRVPHEVMLEAYRELDVVMLPSLVEGIPVTLMEAMAAGVPVVATALEGVRELLDGGAGLMVPPKDPQALANTLQKLFTSPSLYEECVYKGWKRVAKEFSVQQTVQALIHLWGGAPEHAG
ncbi:MAG: glycosyltransferase family 4 protein [Firmicutes bacterium]|nr:glycosyltransferase family 4 protein [Bacillota bacterium]